VGFHRMHFHIIHCSAYLQPSNWNVSCTKTYLLDILYLLRIVPVGLTVTANSVTPCLLRGIFWLVGETIDIVKSHLETNDRL
jgi:hypothetical protein